MRVRPAGGHREALATCLRGKPARELGFNLADLFIGPRPKQERGSIVAVYEYFDQSPDVRCCFCPDSNTRGTPQTRQATPDGRIAYVCSCGDRLLIQSGR